MRDPEFIECRACAGKPRPPYLCTSCRNNREAIFYLLEVLRAAEKIEGWHTDFHKSMRPAVNELHRAIRKAKGMS